VEGLSDLPAGAAQGQNDFGRTGYGGPCPPSGRHRYVFRLSALDTRIEGPPATLAEVARAMEGHVLARGELAGTYEKGR
jgi:Raf kinase inhibitor-like YbhB/YbcL family protein